MTDGFLCMQNCCGFCEQSISYLLLYKHLRYCTKSCLRNCRLDDSDSIRQSLKSSIWIAMRNLKYKITRLHSSSMRTVRCSGRLLMGGGVCLLPRGCLPRGEVCILPRGSAFCIGGVHLPHLWTDRHL